MKKIYFHIFRHGQTDWNASKIMQGQMDIPLNGKGRKEAKLLHQYFVKQNIETQQIYSSDLKRAQDTAKIALPNLKVEVSKDLREIHCGEFQGKRIKNVAEKYDPEEWFLWTKGTNSENMNREFPSGESRYQHQMRIKNFLEKLSYQYNHSETIYISSHGGCIRRLLEITEKTEHYNIRISNCSVHQFSYVPEQGLWGYMGCLFKIE